MGTSWSPAPIALSGMLHGAKVLVGPCPIMSISSGIRFCMDCPMITLSRLCVLTVSSEAGGHYNGKIFVFFDRV